MGHEVSGMISLYILVLAILLTVHTGTCGPVH